MNGVTVHRATDSSIPHVVCFIILLRLAVTLTAAFNMFALILSASEESSYSVIDNHLDFLKAGNVQCSVMNPILVLDQMTIESVCRGAGASGFNQFLFYRIPQLFSLVA
ncbi:hypothetical protein TNCV_4093311 [Trichonephila clavipes]|nr:hypothetical protein TNCV_4093311 [Trichonephila clavipes]